MWAVLRPGHGHRVVVVIGFHVEASVRLLATDLAEDLLSTHCAEARDGFGKRGVGKRFGETNRWVLADVLGDAGGVADRGGDLVAHNACRGGGFGERTGAAGEEQAVVLLVFLGEKEVRAAGD